MAVLLAWVRVAVFRVLGSLVSGHSRAVAKLIVGVRGTVATDAGVLVILMWLGLGKCTLVGKVREVAWLVSMVKGVGARMSGVRLFGALGRDQTCVSTGNHSYRKNNGRRGGAREGAVPGAGVGPGSGSSRVRFQGELEQDGVPVNKSGVGSEVPNGAQADSGKTQRDKILEAVEALRLLLGQGVCSQVEDLIQDHIPPLPKVSPSPFPN